MFSGCYSLLKDLNHWGVIGPFDMCNAQSGRTGEKGIRRERGGGGGGSGVEG